MKSEGSDPYDDLQVEAAEITLHFEYTPTYPDEPPIMEVTPVENIEDEDLKDLRMQLQEQVCISFSVLELDLQDQQIISLIGASY